MGQIIMGDPGSTQAPLGWQTQSPPQMSVPEQKPLEHSSENVQLRPSSQGSPFVVRVQDLDSGLAVPEQLPVTHSYAVHERDSVPV